MDIGIGLPNQVRNVAASVIPRWAADAERAGFATLATIGRYAYPGVMDTVALAAAGRDHDDQTSDCGFAPDAGDDGVRPRRLPRVVERKGIESRCPRWHATGAHADRWILRAHHGALGDGYIGGALPVDMTAPAFADAKRAWREAGRPGKPKLVVLAYFSLADTEAGLANVRHFYQVAPDRIASSVVVCTSRSAVADLVDRYTQLDVDEIVFIPGTDNRDEVSRLADAVGSIR